MSDDTSNILTQFSDLLKKERDVIKTAAFSELGALITRKEELLSALEAAPQTDLTELHRTAIRNQELLQAAIMGVQNARDRLSKIAESAKGFTGYDQFGKPKKISRNAGTVEKRA